MRAKTCSQTREIVKNLSQTTKCISQTRKNAPKCSFYNLIFCCILPESVFYNLIFLLQPLWNQFS